MLKAFTLIELLVVLVLIAICMASVIPRFSNTLQAIELEQYAENIVSEIQFCRQYAMTTQGLTTFVIDSTINTIEIIDEVNKTCLGRQTLDNQIMLKPGKGFTSLSNKKYCLLFKPNGTTQTVELSIANGANVSDSFIVNIKTDGTVAKSINESH